MMKITRYRHARRLLLLLLTMVAGANGAWAEGVTANAYYLAPSNSPGNIGGDWVSHDTERYTVDTSSGYTSIAVGSKLYGDNGTRVYTNSTSNLVGAGVSFILQFDIKVTGGSNQPSWFQVNDFTNAEVQTGESASKTTASSILQLAQKTAGGTEWAINGSETQSVTLDKTKWYRFILTRTYDKTYLKVLEGDASSVTGSSSTLLAETEITTNSTVGGLGRMEFATKRYNSSLAIDNLSVQKWGWDVASHTVSLTSANNDNKITSGMPVLYNPDGAAVTYTYDGTVLGNYDQTYNPSPRLKATGTGTVTATIGGKKTQYSLTVTSPTVTGTYDASTNTYTFDKVGIISSHSIDAVPFINMSFRGGPTAVVVNDGTRTVLKVIDANGYSHPNLNEGGSTIPPEDNWGGTFYKFVPSVNGKLTVTGNMNYAKLYESDGTTLKASADTGTEITDVSLESGKTYYLYNAGNTIPAGKTHPNGSSTPLLHSFKFVPDASSLTFRNPQSVITVDVSETSYTNPAISVIGLPVSYSIASGSSIADVDVDGKVTFKGDYFLNPQPIVISATTAPSGSDYVSYTINLVKRTWIFNEHSKWKTTTSELTTDGGWDGEQQYAYSGLSGDNKFYRNKKAMSYEQLTKDGTNAIPETDGLLFNKESNNDRLYIAPQTYSTNFLAMRASDIGIDDVQAGQVVTVNWTGGNSSSVLDLTDAAGVNVTGSKGGTLQLLATQTGRVVIHASSITSYINSITVSTPTRAIGTLTYAKNVLSTGGEVQARTGYTITTEDGTVNLREAYNAIGNFKSSNTSVATVDASGNITPVGVGTAIITATATAKNSATHQAVVTLVATIEVVDDAGTRIRTISISDLLYSRGVDNKGVNANAGLDRRIPGFDLTFEGKDGAKVNDPSILILRYKDEGNAGKLTITPRRSSSLTESENITITKALVTVTNVSKVGDGADTDKKWKVNGATAVDVTTGGITYSGLTGNTLTLETTIGAISLSSIKIYYTCSNSAKADECLDETKIAPTINFAKDHLMRIPGDGKAFTQTPTQVITDKFKSFLLSYTYTSSATTVATINTDGTNGQLLKSGESTITATFNETNYFAGTSASYTVDNVLLKNETYDDVAINNDQRIHIEASAYANNTSLTLIGATGTTPHLPYLTYDTERSRNNTYATVESNPGSLTLKNENEVPIVIYSMHVVTSNLRKWLYYQGQADNYSEQVLFTGFESGAVAGFRVVDVGDPDNPIDLTNAYELSGGYTVGNSTLLPWTDAGTGAGTGAVTASATAGSSTLTHDIKKKTGMADGYDTDITITTNVQVLTFDDDHDVVWDFMSVDNGTGKLGRGWTYDEREFQYGYFSEYTPIFNNGNTAVIDHPNSLGINTHMHGILLKDEFRWYHTRGLRANLSQPKASFKFPVKAGMEIDIYAATSSADISNDISNVTDINGNDTEVFYIEQEGEANPAHYYFLAKEDGMVEVKATDKVGMYLHSITLTIPKIHFADDVVTVLPTGDNGAGIVSNPTINIPGESLTHLSYSLSSETDFAGDAITTGDLATIDTKGQITLTHNDKEGWFEVTVTNNNPGRKKLDPKTGSYKVYVVDFKFDPSSASLNLDNHGGEDYYGGDDTSTNHYPVGKDYVVTPINYSYEIAEGNSARAMLKQTTKAVPGQTAYQLIAYSPGAITLYAKTGRITAKCNLTVGGYAFEKVAPVLSDKDIAADDYAFLNKLPDDFSFTNTTLVADLSGDMTAYPLYSIVTVDGKNYVQISKIKGKGHGAIRYTATDNNGTVDDKSDDKVIQFVLTIAYPASSNKKWDFYRMKHGVDGTNGLSALTTYNTTPLNAETAQSHDNRIDYYSSSKVSDYTIQGTNLWQTTTTWNRVYRNGIKDPRWALSRSMRRDNAFVIEETAGLQIETPTNSFYVDNNDTYSDAGYTHIGIHSRSTITIPKLKNGDFISLNLSRVIPNKGAIIDAENVTDLSGKIVNSSFTITRSQTDYRENGELAVDGSGARVIPGYYTFIAHKDGVDENTEFDVSFTLADEGHLDVLGIEIYAPNSRNSGNGNDPENGYDYTMLPIRLDDAEKTPAPATLLKEEGQQMVYELAICHYMWSTSVGPAEYVVRETTDKLNVNFRNVGGYSKGGAFYNNGEITVNNGYGRIKLRMENYTADGKYLIGYTPDYSLTVGIKPHQDYPFTWDFTNISGGVVKGKNNNVYNSVRTDYLTWTNLGYETFELDTETNGGSLYVPGATLVTIDRNLGAKGTISELNAAGKGCDELNGLGFNGQVVFKLAQQGAEADDVPTGDWSRGAENSLLTYTLNDAAYESSQKKNDGTKDVWTPAELTAGDGKVMFGSPGKREAPAGGVTMSVTNSAYVYKMDGGNSKNVKLIPQRPFQNGDVIHLTGYSSSNVLKSGFSFYGAANDEAGDALVTINWTNSEANTEATLDYTVTRGDGIAGRKEVYLFRADKQYTVYLSKVSIMGDDTSAPTAYERALTCEGKMTLTIPDLKVGHYVYIKSSAAPTGHDHLTDAVAGDGLDAGDGVFKYVVNTAGAADVTFASGTKIYRIGVTNIMKPLTRVGTGDAWATESRDHAIDYRQTGYLTVNDIKAHTVAATNYTLQKVTVRLNELTDAVPAETGLVLKLKLVGAEDDETTANVNNFAKAKGGNSVPLFYPPYSATILNSTTVGFGGTQGNLMMANLDERELTEERETGVIDKNRDNVDDSGADDGDYTRFLLAQRYMKWTKVTSDGVSAISHSDGFTDSGDVPVFYRMHKYTTTELNTLGANKAYMLIRSGNVPDALWKGEDPAVSRRYIGIEGVSDMDEYIEDSQYGVDSDAREGTYDLRGRKVADKGNLRPGVYIRDGRKIVVK